MKHLICKKKSINYLIPSKLRKKTPTSWLTEATANNVYAQKTLTDLFINETNVIQKLHTLD